MLHGNRTYLLMNDDGQINEAHSISAGLDYPGIGPEHAWLNDVGRVTFLSATDDEALNAFQLLSKLEGIIPALEPAHAIAKVLDLAPQKPKDHLMVVNLSGRGDKDLDIGGAASGKQSAMTDPHRSALCRAQREGRAALVTFIMAGDPDYATVARDPQSAAAGRRRRDRARHAVHRSDGRRAGDPGGGPARAQGRAEHEARRLRWCANSARGDDATPIVLMGYYNPIYVYGVERFLADAKAAGVDGLIVVDLPPEEDAELCLPALKAGFNFIRLATPTTDDKRLPAVLTNTSGFVYYVSITGITGSAAPDPGKVAAAVARIKRHTKLPVCVGFGVRTAEQARAIAEGADGVVVGSALVEAVRKSLGARRQGDGRDGRRRSPDLVRALGRRRRSVPSRV